jgi:hypothetical protein
MLCVDLNSDSLSGQKRKIFSGWEVCESVYWLFSFFPRKDPFISNIRGSGKVYNDLYQIILEQNPHHNYNYCGLHFIFPF